MYPRINELVRILHGHDISSFLVTNAQFPDAIRWVLNIHFWVLTNSCKKMIFTLSSGDVFNYMHRFLRCEEVSPSSTVWNYVSF